MLRLRNFLSVLNEAVAGEDNVTKSSSWLPSLLSLGRKEAHVWCVCPDSVTDPALLDAYLEPRMEKDVTCCYAVQDKAWVTDPDNNAWEIFVVLDADASSYKSNGSTTCCTGNKEEPRGNRGTTSCCS